MVNGIYIYSSDKILSKSIANIQTGMQLQIIMYSCEKKISKSLENTSL